MMSKQNVFTESADRAEFLWKSREFEINGARLVQVLVETFKKEDATFSKKMSAFQHRSRAEAQFLEID